MLQVDLLSLGFSVRTIGQVNFVNGDLYLCVPEEEQETLDKLRSWGLQDKNRIFYIGTMTNVMVSGVAEAI